MCGILGIAGARAGSAPLDDRQVCRLRDLMTHRGPDGAGLWRDGRVVLAHRRLAVIDPSDSGAQPMLSAPDPQTGLARFALVYNGELYNDAELRSELAARGVHFRSHCDTETVLHAMATWGVDALPRLRGIFALALYDRELRTLTLARDPLGVKPLYWWSDGRQLVFASEPGPILAHPDVPSAPDLQMVSAYLTTIRTTLAGRTMFEGVRALRPGEMLQCDLDGLGGALTHRAVTWWRGPRAGSLGLDETESADRLRAALAESVRRQLRSDVPVCCLLSGGLDSTAITALARAHKSDLLTFCAGAPVPNECTQAMAREDLACARRAARAIGTRHAEAHVTREIFTERWPRMIAQMRAPLSTPNEVAIHAVALRLRESGCIVTLSGEGADELLAGYEGPMDAAAAFAAGHDPSEHPGLFELNACAWAPVDFKPGLLQERHWRALDQDAWLTGVYRDEFDAAAHECATDGLDAHLRLHRRINLTGLLQRLDSATMLASVEGRTPFADSEVAALCESMDMAVKFREKDDDSQGRRERVGGVATESATEVRTKLALRRACAGMLPDEVLTRPKASFPLPFQQWVGDHAGALERSSLAKELFTGPAIEAVSKQPEKLWNLAWPMVNLALWGETMGW